MEFPKGVTTIAKVIEFTEHFFGGGTHYETPLQQGLDIVKKYAAEKKPKPDIVFITDGICSIQPEFQTKWDAVKHATQMRCYGVMIGGGGQTGALHALSDNVRTIDQMNSNPDGMRDVFRTM